MSLVQDAIPEDPPAREGERLKLVLAWLVVSIPALWGVAQVVVKSTALFRR
jgi:hypothetical protein